MLARNTSSGTGISPYLFQGSVRNSKTAEPQVSQRLFQLSEKAGVGSLLEILVGQKEDEFLTDAFHQLCLWNMVANHVHQLTHIPYNETKDGYHLSSRTWDTEITQFSTGGKGAF
jgi:hypothetical protein